MKNTIILFLITSFCCKNSDLLAQTNILTLDFNRRLHTIDGFGAHQSGEVLNQSWWNQLFFEDMDCSIFRVDLTPVLVSPYSDLSYYSPWFMGSQTRSVFNLEDPANPNGPEGNRVRTYTSAQDYGRTFGGRSAPIAVMGPDLERNIPLFRYQSNQALLKLSEEQAAGNPRILTGSIWSPLPWVKISSGNRYNQNWWPGPVQNTPWPFVWGGNFAGGRLDVSNTPLQVFNDQSMGGSGPTSALTQFARSTAAYIAGYQRFHKVKFYSISIQNELNFEQFYNSATYPLSSQYIAALKLVRTEFDKYPELKDIKIMGPEDLLGGDAYGLWEYGGPIHKNLQYLRNIDNDQEAKNALDFFCIHGYASDGVSSAGSDPRTWQWWANGWTSSPAAGIPSNVNGFTHFGKKSWMTETSGEHYDWIFPKTGFPGQGGFSIALKIHQALTTGVESAWIYWTFSDVDANGNVSDQGLTSPTLRENSPKYVAAKHFFKFIRPGSVLLGSQLNAAQGIHSSSYYNESSKTLVTVIINASSTQQALSILWPANFHNPRAFYSSENNYWQSRTVTLQNNESRIMIDRYSVMTVLTELSPSGQLEWSGKKKAGFHSWIGSTGTSNKILIHAETSQICHITLLSLEGKTLFTSNRYSLNQGLNELDFDLQKLGGSTILLSIQGQDEKYIDKIAIP
ncbi:MAG: hypothetical protein IPM48_05320 [Saprospiraceae bacterium]|nr:hypothetical protein [Saprospiraceae bacterium]